MQIRYAAALTGVMLAITVVRLSAANYTFKTLEPFQPNAISGVDVVVGQAGIPVEGRYRFQGFFTTVVDPSLPDAQTVLTGVNRTGTIVGFSITNGGLPNRGFVLRDGAFQTITIDGGAATPFGINDLGDIIGTYGDNQGFLLVNGVVTKLTNPVAGINNKGDYVANAPNGQAYMSVNGVVTPVAFPGASRTTVAGINDQDVVVGSYLSSNSFGFVLQNGIYTEIDYPADAFFTYVTGINASGQITGYSIGPAGLTAFIGTPAN